MLCSTVQEPYFLLYMSEFQISPWSLAILTDVLQVLSVLSDELQNSSLHQATSDPFHIPLNALFTNNVTI